MFLMERILIRFDTETTLTYMCIHRYPYKVAQRGHALVFSTDDKNAPCELNLNDKRLRNSIIRTHRVKDLSLVYPSFKGHLAFIFNYIVVKLDLNISFLIFHELVASYIAYH